MSASEASGRPKCTLVAIVVSNRNGSWGTITIVLRSEAKLTSRRSTPLSSTRPSSGSASRVSSLASVVFPDPVAPTTATAVLGSIRNDTCRSAGCTSVTSWPGLGR